MICEPLKIEIFVSFKFFFDCYENLNKIWINFFDQTNGKDKKTIFLLIKINTKAANCYIFSPPNEITLDKFTS